MIGLFLFIAFCNSIVFVKQQTVGIIERLGKFKKMATAGMTFKVPFIDNVAGRVDLRIQQLDVQVETKTKDNVFVTVLVSVQYFILEKMVFNAFYKLHEPDKQITSYVFDVVRAKVPSLNLDDVFEKKDDIANAVKEELTGTMDDFGYGITKALITDLDPDQKVKDAMNEINASQRMRMAATEKGEAERILKVKQAEAEAQSKALQGKGIADQRKAIIDGLKESVNDFKCAVEGSSSHDVMNLVLMTQYFDMLKEVGATSKAILIPYSAGGVKTTADEIRNAIVSGIETTK